MHHSRRKSGHGLGNTSMTDVRKATSTSDSKHRSSTKQTTSSRRSGGSLPSSKSSKTLSSRDAEKPREDDYYYDDERESFPQFCMTCEKQFVAKDDRFLYCSETCRDYDQEHGASVSNKSLKDSYSSTRIYYTQAPEPRDIIPRASPSRPSSTYYAMPASTPPTLPTAASTSSAVAALRSLSLRDSSPPSPIGGSSASGIWPFSSRSTAVSPSTSYTQPTTIYASTYDHGYYRTGAPNYYAYGAGSAGYSATDRPLPPRRPGSYSRPKSIELVTPLLGQ